MTEYAKIGIVFVITPAVTVICRVKFPAHIRAGLPGNVNLITGSAFLPTYLATAGRQGGASSRLARGDRHDETLGVK